MTTATGEIVDRLVECPLCKGQGRLWGSGGCPICTNGLVKQRNLDRAREPLPEQVWTPDALTKLFYMVTTRAERRRIRNRTMRAWLADNEPESRLDRLDREHREKRASDDGS